MAITGKPQKPLSPEPDGRPSEQQVRELINKGGSVAARSRSSDPAAVKPMLVQMRIYPDMIEEIDAVRRDTGGRKRRPPSRHAWIIEAIEEKLARDRQRPQS